MTGRLLGILRLMGLPALGVAGLLCLWLFGGGGPPTASAVGAVSGAEASVPGGCGLAWRVVPSPDASFEDNTLRAVAALAADNVWAVGWQGLYGERAALVEHWDGKQWSVIPAPDAGVADSHLQGITAIAPDDIWAVGSAGSKTLTEHWDGANWKIARAPGPSPSGNYLNAVSAVSHDDVWAAGYYEDGTWYKTLIEHWEGQQWSVVPSPNIDEANTILLGVSARAPGDVWAVGDYAGGSVLQTLALHWDGQAWQNVDSPNPAMWAALLDVSALSANDVWAVGAYNDYSPMRTLIEHWDGHAWTQMPGPDPYLGPLASLAVVSPSDIWAVGEKVATNSTLFLHWDGSTWSVVPGEDPGSFTNYLHGVSAAGGEIWTVGDFAGADNVGHTLTERYSDPCAGGTPTPVATATAISTPTSQSTQTATPSPSATPCLITFSDVRTFDYFYSAVSYLYCHGAISGYSDGTFRPFNDTTRGQLSKIVVLAEGWTINTVGGPHFSDVPPSNAFYSFIETAYNHRVISGYADGTFRWANNVTRAQLSKIVVSAQGWSIDTTGGPHFSDVAASSPFYGFVETAYNRNIISGYADGTFRPGGYATRGQISKVLYGAVAPGD